MRLYQVWLKSTSAYVDVRADDVNLDTAGDGGAAVMFWNFLVRDEHDRDDDVTVAAFPFTDVSYVLSRTT
jgi:hypothetical protein